MSAYDPGDWTDFAVAVAGASAALTGLLFVAVSLNLETVLQYRKLAPLAAKTLGLLSSVLIVAICLLVPGQPATALGLEVAVTGLVMLTWTLVATVSYYEPGEPLSWLITPFIRAGVASVLMLVGGMSILAGSGGGLYWLFAAVVAAFLGAAWGAWVLLVEVRR